MTFSVLVKTQTPQYVYTCVYIYICVYICIYIHDVSKATVFFLRGDTLGTPCVLFLKHANQQNKLTSHKSNTGSQLLTTRGCRYYACRNRLCVTDGSPSRP